MGADKVEEELRPLLRAVHDAGHPVVWTCDPMHGNTYATPSGRKTRHLDTIIGEIAGFVRAHKAEGTWPGGIHIELTGDDVTECLGGADDLGNDDLDDRYETVCDPRLNGRQSLDLAFRVAELIRANGI
jgi:3-deoxy-7-phosphoheptulonate synthase